MDEIKQRKTFSELQMEAHSIAKEKGWWDKGTGPYHLSPIDIAAHLALVHSEVSEALECIRRCESVTTESALGKPEGFPSELADVVIRCMDLAAALRIDLEWEIDRKMQYNKTRSHRHGGKVL